MRASVANSGSRVLACSGHTALSDESACSKIHVYTIFDGFERGRAVHSHTTESRSNFRASGKAHSKRKLRTSKHHHGCICSLDRTRRLFHVVGRRLDHHDRHHDHLDNTGSFVRSLLVFFLARALFTSRTFLLCSTVLACLLRAFCHKHLTSFSCAGFVLRMCSVTTCAGSPWIPEPFTRQMAATALRLRRAHFPLAPVLLLDLASDQKRRAQAPCALRRRQHQHPRCSLETLRQR